MEKSNRNDKGAVNLFGKRKRLLKFRNMKIDIKGG